MINKTVKLIRKAINDGKRRKAMQLVKEMADKIGILEDVDLTPLDKEVIEFIELYKKDNGFRPSIKRIALHFGTSVQNIYRFKNKIPQFRDWPEYAHFFNDKDVEKLNKDVDSE